MVQSIAQAGVAMPNPRNVIRLAMVSRIFTVD